LKNYLSIPLVVFALTACATVDDVSTTDCGGYLPAFASFPDLVSAECDATDLLILSETGLADPDPADQSHRMMVGIEGWILRVPLPFTYDWQIPLEPDWSDEIIEASPRGPIAVAANGVPIFHYERRPDVSTHPEHYDAGSDTVVQGELDHCGGHSGQGDDYHYHYTPVCLLEQLDVEDPIAFGLDGVPIYFGTGGDDFYGEGRYSDLDNLPDEPLDMCNALDEGDGTWSHYTTREPPYMVGCHHASIADDAQIEPSPLRQQGSAGPYGGFVGEPMKTIVFDLFTDDDGWTRLLHESFTDSSETSGVLFRASSQAGDCWDFDFREDIDTQGTLRTHCR
jgi:hypothetical protein